MSYWIEFIEQAGNGKDFSNLSIEKFDNGRLHIEISDTYTDLETKPCIILKPKQVEQLKEFLNNED
jgi:hypothetical protein